MSKECDDCIYVFYEFNSGADLDYIYKFTYLVFTEVFCLSGLAISDFVSFVHMNDFMSDCLVESACNLGAVTSPLVSVISSFVL